MAINLRRDAWQNEQQYDAIRQMSLEIERLRRETEQRFGSWTPGFTFGGSNTGITYSLQSGFWMKQGKFVVCFGAVTLTSNGTGVGTALLTGLPFFVKDIVSGTTIDGFGRFGYFTNIGVALDELFLVPTGDGTLTATIAKIANGGTAVNVATEADIADTFLGRPFLVYLTDTP